MCILAEKKCILAPGCQTEALKNSTGSLTPEGDVDIAQWWLAQRMRVDHAARPTFDSMFLLLAWNVWKHRNDIVFQRWPSPSLTRLRREAEDWLQAGYLSVGVPSSIWSQLSTPM